MPETATAAIKLGTLLLQEAQKQGLIEKFKLLFKSKPRILLLGSTGAGKTNFLESLSVIRPEPIPRGLRTTFASPRTLLVKRAPFRFIDTPGDASPGYKDARIQAIREAMSAKGGIAGIINVVAYGYHEYDVEKGRVFFPNGSVKPEFLTQHRQFEIDQLAEWTALLGHPDTTKWLITLVTKADLWWNEKDAVKNHYANGPYHAALGDAQILKPKVLFYSSVFSKFFGEAPLSGYFDEHDRETLKHQFVQALLTALIQHEV